MKSLYLLLVLIGSAGMAGYSSAMLLPGPSKIKTSVTNESREITITKSGEIANAVVIAHLQDDIEEIIKQNQQSADDREKLKDSVVELQKEVDTLRSNINLIGIIGGTLMTSTVSLLAIFRLKRVSNA